MTEEKRPRGRPEIGPEVRGLRLPPEVIAEVEALAHAAGVKRAEILRDLVVEALTARQKARPGSQRHRSSPG